MAGQKLKGYDKRDITYENLSHDDVRKMSGIDVWIMALPNGVAKPWIDAIEEGNSGSLIIDLSADFRFDPAWTYGLPELVDRSTIAQATRISNVSNVTVFMQMIFFIKRDKHHRSVQDQRSDTLKLT